MSPLKPHLGPTIANIKTRTNNDLNIISLTNQFKIVMSGSASQSSFQTKTAPGSAPNGLGRGLFASSDFRPGDDILHIQSPYVAVLDTPRLADTCSGCFGKRQLEANADNKAVLKACTGCQVVKYCDTVRIYATFFQFLKP